jgi:hypothetical protein
MSPVLSAPNEVRLPTDHGGIDVSRTQKLLHQPKLAHLVAVPADEMKPRPVSPDPERTEDHDSTSGWYLTPAVGADPRLRHRSVT